MLLLICRTPRGCCHSCKILLQHLGRTWACQQKGPHCSASSLCSLLFVPLCWWICAVLLLSSQLKCGPAGAVPWWAYGHAPGSCMPLHPQPWPAGPFYHDWGLEAICWGLQVLQATRKCSCERCRGCQWAWHPTGAWGLLVSGKAWDDLPFAAAEGKSRTPGSGVTTGCVLAPCPGANWPWSQRKEEKFSVSQQALGPGHLLAAGTCDRAVPHVHTWDMRGLRSLPSLPSPLSCYPSMLPQCLAKHVCTSVPLLAGDVSPGMVCIVPPWCATGTVSPHLCQQQRHAQKAVGIYTSNQLFFSFHKMDDHIFSWGILQCLLWNTVTMTSLLWFEGSVISGEWRPVLVRVCLRITPPWKDRDDGLLLQWIWADVKDESACSPARLVITAPSQSHHQDGV